MLSLNFFGQLVSRIPSLVDLEFGTLEEVFSRIPSRGGLGLGHSSGSEPVTLPATLIHFSENGGRLEAIDRLFRLVRANCLVFSCVVSTKG